MGLQTRRGYGLQPPSLTRWPRYRMGGWCYRSLLYGCPRCNTVQVYGNDFGAPEEPGQSDPRGTSAAYAAPRSEPGLLDQVAEAERELRAAAERPVSPDSGASYFEVLLAADQ